MGLTVNRQMALKLTANRQKRNNFTVNRQMSEPKRKSNFSNIDRDQEGGSVSRVNIGRLITTSVTSGRH